MNSISYTTRIGREPALKEIKGMKLVEFSIPEQKDKDSKTTWIECKAWGKTAEFIAQWFKKGSWIVLSGTFSFEHWTDKEGNEKSKPVITVDRAGFCGPKVEAQDDSEVPF